MKIKHWDEKTKTYDREKECDTTVYSLDMTLMVECCECGDKVRYGNAYTSRHWFSPNGFWGMPECEKCYAKHNWQKEADNG